MATRTPPREGVLPNERVFASMDDLRASEQRQREALRDSEARQDKRLDDILATMRAGHLHLEQHLNAIETRLEGRLEGLEGRLEGRMDGLERRMDGLEGRMGGLEGRMDGLENRLGDMGERLTRLEESKRIIMWVIGLGVPILIGVALILVRLWMG